MKAAIRESYGGPDVIRIADIDAPRPADTEILIAVKAAAINPLDWHMMRGTPYVVRVAAGLPRPRSTALGGDLAGVVQAVGASVSKFAPGDRVFGQSIRTLAEFVVVSEGAITRMSDGMSFTDAASIPIAGMTALQGLRDSGRLAAGQRVLINGASGGVGTFAIQIAVALGAEVTAVCSDANVDLARSLGATDVIDYVERDFTRTGERYDLVFDLAGHRSLADLRRALTPTGTLVSSSAPKGDWFDFFARPIAGVALSPFTKQRLVTLATDRRVADLDTLRDMIDAGQITPVIDSIRPMVDTAAAIEYLERGHARGKVVIEI